MTDFEKTDVNRVRRLPARGAYDRELIHAILDEALICHVGFVEDGRPFVIPTIHARSGDIVYLHGAPASRMLKVAGAAQALCVTATLLDGLVMARSVFHHSMNYRSAVVFGTGRMVTDDDEKMLALEAITEHVARGRWYEARLPNRKELDATRVIAMQIEQASAKTRSGPPGDDDEDYALPIWAGVLPLAQQPGTPVPDPLLRAGIDLPGSITPYTRR